MDRHIKPCMVLMLLLGFGASYCHAGTYISKKNPEHSAQYKEAPGIHLTARECKDYSRQNSLDLCAVGQFFPATSI